MNRLTKGGSQNEPPYEVSEQWAVLVCHLLGTVNYGNINSFGSFSGLTSQAGLNWMSEYALI